MTPAVFLDRDGVINESPVVGGRPYPPQTLDAFRMLPGVAETLRALRARGLLAIVATNQPDVAAGRQQRHVVDAMHQRIRRELAIDDIRTCWCLEGEGCDCYKPKPGLLLDAARDWSIDLAASFMVGDRWRDIGAGRAAGCRTIFVDHGYTERAPDRPDFVVRSLAEALPIILGG